MIISYLDVVDAFVGPSKAESVFSADPNGLLPLPVADERVQLVAGWTFEIIENFSGIEIPKLSACR